MTQFLLTTSRNILVLSALAGAGTTLVYSSAQAADFLTVPQQRNAAIVQIKAQADAEAFISSMAQRALDFLSNAQQTQAQKAESFRRLLEDNYDMNAIGRFTLGRYWKTATPQQQAEFQKLFKSYVVQLYSQRFSEYKGQKFEVTGSRQDDADTIVSSKVLPADGGQEVTVDWRVRNSGGRYRVVDVIVAGVSMSMTQRSDFASVIQQGGGNVDALLTSLKQKS
jgi:phospholipid transport system substrate-binding protein